MIRLNEHYEISFLLTERLPFLKGSLSKFSLTKLVFAFKLSMKTVSFAIWWQPRIPSRNPFRSKKFYRSKNHLEVEKWLETERFERDSSFSES